jgi:ribosome maturation factor RimP
MDRETQKQEINFLVKDLFTKQGFVLVDIISRPDGSGLLLSLLVDRPQGGISLEDCGLLNRLARQALDEKNILSGQYSLEVSSPGIDRPLKTKEDFMRCFNKPAVFFLNDLVNGKCQWQGVISKVGDLSVFIYNSGQLLEIPLIKINKAQLIVEKKAIFRNS